MFDHWEFLGQSFCRDRNCTRSTVHQSIEASKLFEQEVLRYEEDLQFYIDSMDKWRMEPEQTGSDGHHGSSKSAKYGKPCKEHI